MTRCLGVCVALGLTLAFVPAEVSAASSLARCRRTVDDEPRTRESWGCFYRAARSGADWSTAEATLRASMLDNAVALAEPNPRGYALLTLANIVAEHDPEAGLELYAEALESLTAGEDHLARILTLLNMAHRFRSTGSPQRGAEALAVATLAAEALGDPQWVASVAVESVRHDLRTQGDLGRAERRLAEVEPLLFPDGSVQAKLTWLNAATAVAQHLGKLQAAHTLAERLVALAAAEGDTYVQAAGLYNVLLQRRNLRFEAGGSESPAFVQDVRDALELASTAQNTSARLSLQQLLADALVDLGSLEEAERIARMSLADAAVFADPRLEVGACFALARTLLRRAGTLADAARAELATLVDRARALATSSEQPDLLTVVSLLEAEVAWRAGNLNAAIQAHEASLRSFEGVRAVQANLQGRAELLSRQGEVFKSYVAHLLERADGSTYAPESPEDVAMLGAAFGVSERYRARALRETRASAGPQPSSVQTRDAINRVQRVLGDTTLTHDQRVSARAELELLERQELEDLAMRTAPLAQEGLIALSDLAAALGPDEALLSYQLAGRLDFARDQTRGSWVLVVTREQIHATRLPPGPALRPALEMFGPAVEQGLDASVRVAAQTLGRQLIEDPLAALRRPPKQLTLLLDEQLHQIPFAALRNADGRLLVERYAIAIAPSASILRDLRATEPPQEGRARSVLALADPGIADPSRVPARALLLEGTSPLEPLPHAREEARRAAYAPGDTAWFGDEASETALLAADLERYGVLHFATHAIVDGATAQRSAIVLAPGDADGLLQPRDIAQLGLSGKLVVLSACRSAGGQVLSGEGVLGLSHALFSAEAATVVGTLWPIPDDEAMRLFEHFYAELDAGRTVSAALARAQSTLAAEGAPSTAWAGAVVLGDGALVPFRGGRAPAQDAVRAPRDRSRLVIGAALLSTVGFGVFFGVRRRRSRAQPADGSPEPGP